MLEDLATWLKATELSSAITQSRWLWPASETLHFMGLALLLGTVGLLDMRVLGLGKKLPVEPLHRLVPWGIGGFVVNIITGLIFFIGEPAQYVNNIAFLFKMIFMLLAGLNVIVFYLTVFRDTEALKPGQDAGVGAKVICGTSIFLWIGVLYFGRMLPFIGNAF